MLMRNAPCGVNYGETSIKEDAVVRAFSNVFPCT